MLRKRASWKSPISDLGPSDEARIGRTEPLYSSQRREAVFRTSTRYRYLKTATTTSATKAAIII